jgi:hypothetical protein
MSDSPVRLSLSTTGLQRLEGVNHQKDFTFIVGDERYECPTFIAEFLSPRITTLRSQDITISEFSVHTADPNHYFGTLLSLGFGHEVSFTRNELSFVRSVCGELCNYELFENTLKTEGAFGQIREEELKARFDFLMEAEGNCDRDVPIIASHFFELSASDIDKLNLSVLRTILDDPTLVVRDEDSLFEVIQRRSSDDLSYFELLECVHFEFLSDRCMTRAFDFISNSFDSLTFDIWSTLRSRLTLPVTPTPQPGRYCLPAIDSKIISTVPDFFSIFGNKTLHLLYRGSRDGFEGSSFHRVCDGHPHTISLISSTNGSIFGGYTPVAWSSANHYVSDMSMESFVFTITNPHNLSPRIFKQQRGDNAVYHHPSYGPTFGGGLTIHVCDQCRSSNNSYSSFGSPYNNDTGISGNEVLTGACNFTVNEIEVFEVTWRQ